MKKIIFIEGLPGVGKTTLINNIKNKYHVVNIVNEIVNLKINKNINLNQIDYMINDEMKINKFSDGLIIIDRGPISTYAYNITKNKLLKNYDVKNIDNWFNSIKKIYNEESMVYFLNNNSFYIPYEDNTDPYGSIKNQKLLKNITINLIKNNVKNYKIINYDKENMEGFINEIISEYMCS